MESAASSNIFQKLCVVRTADPEGSDHQVSSSSSFVIRNSAQEQFTLTGKFWAVSAGTDTTFLVTAAHPLTPNEGATCGGTDIGVCVILKPDYIEYKGLKYTADLAILKLNEHFQFRDPKVKLEYNDETTSFSGTYQRRLYDGIIEVDTPVCVLNKKGQVKRGLAELIKRKPVDIVNGTEVTQSCYYNLYIMCNNQRKPLTERGDSGCICFLEPNQGDKVLQVFGMCTSRDVNENFSGGAFTYAVNQPMVLRGVTSTEEFKQQFSIQVEGDLKVDFCGEVDQETEVKTAEPESGIFTGATGMDEGNDSAVQDS